MLGAVLGDIIGSHYRNNPAMTKDFPFKATGTKYTGITVMTLAVAKWLMEDSSHSKEKLVEYMQKLGRTYIRAGYSTQFKEWLLSKNPQPYESNQNEAMLFVSPVGLYASSRSEASNLAETIVSCIHNSSEAIKEAETIATCVFKHKGFAEYNAYNFRVIGYLLSAMKCKIVRDSGKPELIPQQESYNRSLFDVIQSLHRSTSLEDCIREAVYSGCDPCSVTSMAASIAMAYSGSRDVAYEWNAQFENYLPRDLKRIMIEFENYVYPSKPTFNSYKVNDWLYAGEYPGDLSEDIAREKIKQFLKFGITHFIDLTEEGELIPYSSLLPSGVNYTRFAIRDQSVPTDIDEVVRLIEKIENIHDRDKMAKVYLHCWGGVGRTGTIVGCFLGNETGISYEKTMSKLTKLFADCPKSEKRVTPENEVQCSFINSFIAHRAELNRRLEDLLQWSLQKEQGLVPEKDKIATADSWKILPHGDNTMTIHANIHLPSWAMNYIKKGRIPEDMDSRYFMYCDDSNIYIHRSWTGHFCYQAEYCKTDDGYTITSITFEKQCTGIQNTYRDISVFLYVLLIEVDRSDAIRFL